MTTASSHALVRLVERNPSISGAEIASELSPPPQFEHASFESYRPDPDFPSQQAALDRLGEFAGAWRAQRPGGFFSRNRKPKSELPGVYLDGGFGVGKTHLLAALWHVAPGPKYFGTFIEYTALVGALGYANALRLLTGAQLICIDEFELDDPGDTMLMTRFLGELIAGGTRVAATSNTPPNALGEGRFAAADFLREIQGLSSHFRPLRIDGEDYRHRGLPEAPAPYSDEQVTRAAYATEGASLDDFPSLLDHLARVHPSRYGSLTDGIRAVCLTDVQPVPDQSTALRLVVLADRMYDREIPVLASGLPFDRLFSDEMLNGGYRKKYFRAISRLTALARDAKGLVAQ
jgi:cell division protein ZapE